MSKVTKAHFVSFVAKGAIIFFYGLLLAFFLYFTYLYDFFSKDERCLNVYTFMDVVSEEFFEEFEKKNNVKVNLNYFCTNEELLAKFKVNRGKDYDLVIPSDYAIELLYKGGLLQSLDLSKISNFSELDPHLLNHPFDPENKYSIPLCWYTYGIGFNKKIEDIFSEIVSWGVVFDKLKEMDYNISMLDDAREAIFLASIYLFQQVEGLTKDQFEAVKDTLIKQKKFVECYTESGALYLLLSNIVSLAVLPSCRMKDVIDIDGDQYGFLIPKEGTIVDLENLAIPATCEKPELAHKLIDFLISKKIEILNFNAHGCNPSNKLAYDEIDQRFTKDKAFFPDDKAFAKLYFIHNKIPAAKIEKLWFSVKAA